MNKNWRMSSWFFVFLFVLSSSPTKTDSKMSSIGVASIRAGCVAVAQPLVHILSGAAAGLTSVAQNMYQAYGEKNKKEDNSCSDIPDDVVLAQRLWYDQRKDALEKNKQELLSIKNDLQTLEGLNTQSFTYQFLRQYSYPSVQNVPISLAHEKCLSEDKKNSLRNVREHELLSLEKQIIAIQNVLILHLNQLSENVNWIQEVHNSFKGEIESAIDAWNNNRHTILPDAAFNLYKHDILREHLIGRIGRAFDELRIVCDYYNRCKSKCMRSITQLVEALDKGNVLRGTTQQWLLKEEKRTQEQAVLS